MGLSQPMISVWVSGVVRGHLEWLRGHSIFLEMTRLGQNLRNLWRWRAGAARHSMRLLSDNLSPLQREQLALSSYFEVIGGDTGTRDRIHVGDQMNVEALDRHGRRMQSLCFLPKGHLPIADTMLAQKIALELFEKETLRIARGQPPTWIIHSLERPPYGFRY